MPDTDPVAADGTARVAAMTLVCGIDSSTQSTKVELRDAEDGRLVASASAGHPPTTPPVSEQDPMAWFAALSEAFAQVREHLSDVAAIAVAGQQHGMVLVDDAGAVIRPAKLWNDTTSAPQAARLVEKLNASAWANRSGSVPVASFTITKLAWMADNEPENLARTAKVMLPHDWLTWFLCGEHVTDRGDASGTGWWNPRTGHRVDLLDLAVPDADSWLERMPTVLGPSDTAGHLRPEIADAFGFGPNVVVGPGTGDNMGAALGLGLAPTDVALSLGTSGTAYAVSSKPVVDPTGAVAGFADASGNFLPLIATLNATKVTDAVARWLGTDAKGLGTLALETNWASDAPVLVPWFDGERTPNVPDAWGEFVGLRTSTTRGELARAAHVGVICGLLGGVDALHAAGVDVSGTLRLVGGGARSDAYQQILADLTGRDVHVHDEGELVATGACVQARAVLDGSHVGEVAGAWQLGAARTISPSSAVPADEIRAAWQRAADQVAAAAATSPHGTAAT